MAHSLNAITLPDLVWIDEYDWTAVAQSEGYTLTGALVVEAATKLKGRPITLQGSETHGWASRATVDALRALAVQPGLQMTFTHDDDRVFNVMFRQGETPLEARLVVDYMNPEAADWYALTLRLMEV
jgi:hypothetical protein